MSTGGAQAQPAKARHALRIIVADDDRDAVLTLTMVLRDEGHEVRGVYKGFDVLNQLIEFQPDAILLDIDMPDVNGCDVARRLRTKRGGQKVLLVGVSGVYKKGSDRIVAQMSGFDHYLTKPYDPGEILKLLEPLRVPGPSR